MVNGKLQEQEEVKQDDDKLLTRMMSKEASKANSSCRVYYGSSGAIPFVWESQPGTPKHTLADYDSSNLPPLTPPPSYYSTSIPKSKRYGKNNSIFFIKSNFIRALTLPAKVLAPNKLSHSPSFSISSANSSSSYSSSSSWSSILSPPSLSRSKNFQKLRCFSCSKLPVRCVMYDDKAEHEHMQRGSVRFRGCYSIGNMKRALLSIVDHAKII